MPTKSALSGFTLVELLVVMSIIAVLAAISLTSFRYIQQKSRDGQRQSNIQTLKAALDQYFVDQGFYPKTPNNCELPTKVALSNGYGNGSIPAQIKNYLSLFPSDPSDVRDGSDISTTLFHYTYIGYKDRTTYASDLSHNNINTCDNSTVPCKYYALYAALEDTSIPLVEGGSSVCGHHTNLRFKVLPR